MSENCRKYSVMFSDIDVNCLEFSSLVIDSDAPTIDGYQGLGLEKCIVSGSGGSIEEYAVGMNIIVAAFNET